MERGLDSGSGCERRHRRGWTRLRRAAAIAGWLVGGASLVALSAFVLADALFPLPVASLRRSPSTVIRDLEGRPLRIFLSGDDRYRMPADIDDVSSELTAALVGSEDRWFYWHLGVNPAAVLRAAWSNLRAGRVVSGASTIPMQIARLAVPKPRTLGGKLIEAFRAVQLEWHYDKRELLEIYLNLIPFGGNIEGVGAASFFYFGTQPGQLSLGEAALLTAMPRSPRRYDPVRHPAAARAARDRVLRQLGDRGVFAAEAIRDAQLQDVPRALRPIPFLAPHFSRWVFNGLPEATPEATTTLDLRVQGLVERHISGRVEALRREGIDNVAVVVIENGTRALRAMAGSAEFFGAAHQGQVNGALARRSPGSTLKPFVYALAIDRGIIVPDTYLLDIPTDFSGYIARNYDGEYHGRVLARDALRQSLNASAVRLLARVGLDEFHDFLVRAGLLDESLPPIHYGLPLILGAGEVRLLDLTNLYATLADGGRHRSVQVHADERRAASPEVEANVVGDGRLFSREAATLVTEVLLDVQRPDMPQAWALTRGVPEVAWKTGTSFGHRDAWAVGFSDRYTIGVWVGNPDGRGREGISGARHAGPLLFELFRVLDPRGSPGDGEAKAAASAARSRRSASAALVPGVMGGAARRGLRLAATPVCAESHQLAGPFCPQRTTIPTVAGTTRLPVCELHRRVFVDAGDGTLLAGDCLARRPHRAEILALFPAELTAWWQARGRVDFDRIPPLSPACREILGVQPPRILSPGADTPYLIRPDAPLEHQRIPLVARTDTRRLYWYQDGEMVAAGAADATLFVGLEPGLHRLVVVDGAGRSDTITYRVE